MLIYIVIISAVITRFIPHMPNLAPITALAIFSGAYLPKKQAVGITLAARFISDVFLGFFSWPLMAAVYASHLVGVLFGFWIKKNENHRWTKIFTSSLGVSLIFFLVTNFAFFYGTYDHNLTGIIAAYTNGLPFFRGTLLGDLGYTSVLFGSFEFVKWFLSQRSKFLIPNS